MRGGQVTLFFAVGLVLLFTIAILYLVWPKAQPQIDFQSGSVNNYVLSCLDTIMNNDLKDIGNSGGIVGPAYKDFPATDINGKKILHGITKKNSEKNSDKPGGRKILPDINDSPYYPWPGVSISNTAVNGDGSPFLDFQDGYFGDVQFPGTCSRDNAERCRYYAGTPPGTLGPATQDELIKDVNQKITGCEDLSVFRNAGLNVEKIDPAMVKANITFTQDAVLLHVDYPLTITGKTQQQIMSFDQRYPVRYLAIAQFAYDLAREDTRDVNFDIKSIADYSKLPSWRPGFIVTKTTYQNADLINITDNGYQFLFLREHRLPMLDDVDKSCITTRTASPDEVAVTLSVDGNKCVATDANGEQSYKLIS